MRPWSDVALAGMMVALMNVSFLTLPAQAQVPPLPLLEISADLMRPLVRDEAFGSGGS